MLLLGMVLFRLVLLNPVVVMAGMVATVRAEAATVIVAMTTVVMITVAMTVVTIVTAVMIVEVTDVMTVEVVSIGVMICSAEMVEVVVAVMIAVHQREVAAVVELPPGLLIPPVRFARNMAILQVSVGGATLTVMMMMMIVAMIAMRKVPMGWTQTGTWTLVLQII
jgi:hypothetical protein